MTTSWSGGLWPAAGAWYAGAPIRPDRNQAREWAAQELARREYQVRKPSLLDQALAWLQDHIVLPHGPGSAIGTGLAVLLVAVVIGYALYRVGGLGRVRRAPGTDGVFTDTSMTAAEHRAAAEAAEAAQDWSTAVVERFRAVARGLEERAVITAAPGRTADEVARDAGAWLPGLAEALRSGARTFDDVRYGELAAAAQDARRLRELDDAVRAARPAAVAVAVAGPVVPS